MLRFHPSRFGWILVLALGLWALVAAGDPSAQATQADHSHGYHYRYHYISLDEFVGFNPLVIDDSGRVYGTVRDSSSTPHVAVYADGVVTILQPGIPVVVNARGTIGGYVTNSQTDNQQEQAALFRGKKVEMIPFLPGETQTRVLSLNDSDTALVWSQDPSGLNRNTYRLYHKGKTLFRYRIPTGYDSPSGWGVNNQGIVAGVIQDANLNAIRAIRFRRPYGEPLLLDPLPIDSDSTSFGINNSGYILGMSYVAFGDPTKYHYGIWDWKGNFKPYFEGVFYSFVLFNDKNLIVLAGNDTDFNSYLVPSPGVRLNVKDLLDNPTAVVAPLSEVDDINNHGDMIGNGLCNSSDYCPKFLLRLVSP